MYLLCKLAGAGTSSDPYHIDLPTWRLIDVHYPSLRAVIEVPDSDVPEGLPTRPLNEPWLSNGPLQVAVLSPAALSAWQERVRTRYPQGFAAWEPRRVVE